ncbi:MAG: sodium:proton antiporter [Paludibacter sp. 47-17]|nr:MAG: sodium:proton antiporter [Paludibacter sp. 47-17]
MTLLNILDFTLPLTDPVLKFLIILIIILFAPLLLNKLRIPHLLGLIIAGAAIGPFGLNLMARDSSIILSGTAGLLYIMFLAGLEIDLDDFKKNSRKSLVFGMFTFLVPMIMGVLAGLYVLDFSAATSVLLASMFASHTLIAYPIISKLGVARNRAVSISVGGTLITDTLALLVLAVIVATTQGEVTPAFWIRMIVQLVVFGLIVMLGFPLIGRWFFQRFTDNVGQYVFVLVMVFLGAVLAELAGIEAIIGAFLTGLSLNRLIPSTSPLMNRVEFVGNAIFIPFFLIGVGMLIDYRAFYKDLDTLKVAGVMIVVANVAKYSAAWLTQKTFRLSADERRIIFGLSNAQAAATLAAVLVGYNIILGYTDAGLPVRLLNDSVLNGTILMILVTCTIATFEAQKGAKNIALSELDNAQATSREIKERVLVPLSNLSTAPRLIHLAYLLSTKKSEGFFTMHVMNNQSKEAGPAPAAQQVTAIAEEKAQSLGTHITNIVRYDLNIANGISGVVKENKITDLVLGFHIRNEESDSFTGHLIDDVLSKCNTSTFIVKPGIKPIADCKRHRIIVPENAEKELGFLFWLLKVWNISRTTGAELEFYASNTTLQMIRAIHVKHPVRSEFREFAGWEYLPTLLKTLQPDDNLIVVMSRRDKPSYHPYMNKIPYLLGSSLVEQGFVLLYPMQTGIEDATQIDLKDPTFMEPIEKLEMVRKKLLTLTQKITSKLKS